MKRKLLTTMLALTMTASVATTMVGCDNGDDSHTHTFATEWTTDATHHWYSATCEHTTEVSAKAEHSWGTDGKCSVCQKEKTENGGSSDGLTQTEWNAMFAAEALSNCTIVQTATAVQQPENIRSHQVNTHKFADNKVETHVLIKPEEEDEISFSNVWTGEEAADMKRAHVELFTALLNEYECFEYDTTQDVYNVTETASVDLSLDDESFIVEMSEGQVRVSADGKLVKFSCKYVQTTEYGVVYADMVWEFSDYGTTVIDSASNSLI